MKWDRNPVQVCFPGLFKIFQNLPIFYLYPGDFSIHEWYHRHSEWYWCKILLILTSQHHIQKNLTISSSRCKQTATSGLVKIFLPALRNKMTTIIFTVVLLLTFFQAEPPLQKVNLDRFYDEIPTDNCGKLSQTPFEVTLANDLNIDSCTMMFYHVKHSRQTPPSIPIELKQRWHRAMIMLALSGDISLNPGPVKYPCGLCSKSVASNHRAMLCEVCYYWHHIKCVQISPSEYKLLSASEDSWVCSNCSSFQFTLIFWLRSINKYKHKLISRHRWPCELCLWNTEGIKKETSNKFYCCLYQHQQCKIQIRWNKRTSNW